MRFELESMIAEENRVVCIGIMQGTHDGPFQGIPATNRQTRSRHIHVLRFNGDGLITDHLAVRDDVALLKQLGAIPDELPPREDAE
jgi:predicted ester cyclase